MKPSKLEKAIRAGDLEKVRKLIADGVDVTAVLADGTPPMLLAAREGQVTILRALAAAGADLADLETLDFQERLKLFAESSLDQRPDEDLMNAGELSAWALQAVGERMDDKMRAQIAEFEGPVFRAVRTGDLELLKERIAAGDDLDQVFEVTRDTPLTQAVQKRDVGIVSELLGAGANVNHVGYGTALGFALPDLHLAKLLIEADADVYGRGLDGMTPLARAVHRALHPSTSQDSPILVRFFLEAGVHPPNAESVPGTLLMEAEFREAWEVYQELLPHYPDDVAAESFEELQFNRDMKEYDGGFLHWSFEVKHAARNGDLEELRELLERRRDAGGEEAGGDEESKYAKEAGLAVQEALAHLEHPQGAPQLEAVRVLIGAGADLNVSQSSEKNRGSSPLAGAAESWHRQSKEAMRLLLEAGADVDQRGNLNRTPLMYAVLASYRHGAVLRKAVPLLLQAGADVNLEDEFGLTAWSLAKAPLIEEEERARLGERDAASDRDAPREVFFDGPDLSDLYSAAANKADRRRSRAHRCREALELLEAAGAAAHGEAELRLFVAAGLGDAERVAQLLEAGAGADARGTDGEPAIVAAAKSGCGEAVSRLIAAGCNVNLRGPSLESVLEVAVRQVDRAMTRELLDAGADALFLTWSSNDSFQVAEAAGGADVVEMVRSSLPPDLAHIDRKVELEIAAEDLIYESQRELPRQAALGDLDRVRELLATEGVEVDGFDALRRTALMAAAEAGRQEVVRELIAAGADVDKCNDVVGSPRSTPLICAAVGSSAERDVVLRILLDAGADPDRPGADGRTALMHAVERDVGFFGRIGEGALSTRTLIAAGADLEIRDPYGLTAWMRALSLACSIDVDEVAEQYEAIARLLQEAGASTAGEPDIDLIWEVMVGTPESVSKALAAGAGPSARRHDGATALMLAVRDGELDIVRLLVDAGCDVHAREWVDRGLTALESLDDRASPALVRMLVEAGATRQKR